MTGRACEWCGRAPTTREHLIPQWLRDQISLRWVDDDGLDISVERANEQGPRDGRSHTARAAEVVVSKVCGTCNSGWMADLEALIQPILGPLVAGEARRVDEQDQALLAFWAAKTAVLAGALIPGTVVIDGDDRDQIAVLNQAPLGFHIRLAYRPNIAESPVLLYASSHVASLPGEDPVGDEPNSFSVTWALGHLVVAVVGGPGMRNLDRWMTGSHLPLTIWPPTPGGLLWPPVEPRVGSQDELRDFHEGFWVRITNPEFPRPDARRHIPPPE